MAGRQRPPQLSEDDLLDLDEHEGPIYNSGQPPPISDERMLHDYDVEMKGERISTSHDDFVGSSQFHAITADSPIGAGHAKSSSGAGAFLGDASKNYSQSSGLGNYQRYSDYDHDNDAYSDAGGYYAAGGGLDEDNVPGLPHGSRSKHQSRNSILSLGGGLAGRVKNALGMGPEYSEMDLPLTEQRVQRAESGGTSDGVSPPSSQAR